MRSWAAATSYSTRWNWILGVFRSSGMERNAYEALGSPSRGCPTLPGLTNQRVNSSWNASVSRACLTCQFAAASRPKTDGMCVWP